MVTKNYLQHVFYTIVNFIYQIPSSICIILFAMKKLLQWPFDYLMLFLIKRKIAELSRPESVEQIISLFKGIIKRIFQC